MSDESAGTFWRFTGSVMLIVVIMALVAIVSTLADGGLMETAEAKEFAGVLGAAALFPLWVFLIEITRVVFGAAESANLYLPKATPLIVYLLFGGYLLLDYALNPYVASDVAIPVVVSLVVISVLYEYPDELKRAVTNRTGGGLT